jgi:GT2 family glycosyltransferase
MPEVSIVIPTRGRPVELARALQALEAQTSGVDAFEVLVCVDSPSAAEREAVRQLLERRRFDTKQLQSDGRGASVARNEGLREARSNVVLFLGDDILARPPLVSEHLEWHRRHPSPEVGVLGLVSWADEIRETPFLRWLDRGVQFDFGSIQGDEAGWGRLYTANVSLKREFLEAAGGFDEDFEFLYEDLDLGYRLNEAGLRLLFNPRAAGEHLHAPTLEAWRKRLRLVARAERVFVAKHPEIDPYFHRLFSGAAAIPPLRGRGARLARYVPLWVPFLGPRVQEAAGIWYAQQLAPAFLEAWREAERQGSASGVAG